MLAQKLTLPGENATGILIQGPIKDDVFGTGQFSIADIMNKAMQYIFVFAGIGLLIMIISAGFTLLTSAGDAKKMEKGKQQLTNAFIGFIIIFCAFWITQIVGFIFGIQDFKTIFG